MRLYHTVNLGFFQNYWWMTGVFLDGEIGVGRSLPLGLQGDARLGLGYLHYFWRRKTFVLEDGTYVPATNWGRPSVLVPLSLVLGYRGDPQHPLTISPFLSAQWAAQAPFTDEAPVMTHFMLLVGVRFDRGASRPTGER